MDGAGGASVDARPELGAVDAPADVANGADAGPDSDTGSEAGLDVAAPSDGSIDASPMDASPMDASNDERGPETGDAPYDQAPDSDGSVDGSTDLRDAGGDGSTNPGDGGADGATFSSTPGAGASRSYATALWARSGHTGTVYALDWSRDGALVVSGASDRTIRVFDAQSGNLRRLMAIPQGFVYAAAWSPDGAWIVTGDGQATARLWNGVTGVGVRTFTGHRNGVDAAIFSPDGATIATGGRDGTIVLWSREGGEVRRVLGHPGSIYSLAYRPDGQLLASASSTSVRLWSPETGTLVREVFSPMPMPGADAMTGLAFSPDGTLLLTGSYQQVGRVFRVATGEVVTALSGHTDWVHAVGWNAAGTRALTASWDGTVRVWDVPAFVERHLFSTMPAVRLQAATWSPIADELAAPDAPGGTIRVWDAAAGVAARELTGTAGPARALAYSPDGSQLASGGSDGRIRLWRAGDGVQTRVLAASGPVWAVAWSPTGDRIAVGGTEATGGIWEVATGQRAAGGIDHGARTNAVAWSSSGALLATGGADNRIVLRDLGAGTMMTLSGHTGEIRGLAFSPDGLLLASASVYQEVKIWDTATGALMRTLMGGITGGADAVAFSPDGALLAAAINQNAGAVQLWSTTTWSPVRQLASSTMRVDTIAFSRDGLRLVTGGEDQSVRVWSVATGAQSGAFTGTLARVHHVDFAPGGAHVGFVDDLGTLAVIPAP